MKNVNRLRSVVLICYDRRRHLGGSPCPALGGASSSRCSAERQRGRSRRARSSPRCGASAVLPATADGRDYPAWAGAFLQELGQLGWSIGRNVQIDMHWATANADNIRRHATELAALAPDADSDLFAGA